MKLRSAGGDQSLPQKEVSMQIYDRYGGSPDRARSDLKGAFWQTCLRPVFYCLIWLLILGLVWVDGSRKAFWHVLIWGALFVLAFVLTECIHPLRDNDLQTFGYDGRNFAVMGMNGKPRRWVDVQKLACIRIDEAWTHYMRTRQVIPYQGWGSISERFGGRKRVNGKKRFVAEAMAMLEPRTYKRKTHPYWLEGLFLTTTGDFLINNIGFVLRGENKKYLCSC